MITTYLFGDLYIYPFASCFNLVSSTGLYLPTMYFVSPDSQFPYVHASAYDRILAFLFSLFVESKLIFLILLLVPPILFSTATD